MRLFNWIFGKSDKKQTAQPVVTVGMPSDAWLDCMLDELEEKDRREARKSNGH